MSQCPTDLKYTKSHEWVRREADGSCTVGVTDYAQKSLGDLVFIDLPELHLTFSAGDELAVVESVKAASDIYSPISGEVIAVNQNLVDEPGAVNFDPYGAGWLLRIKVQDGDILANLLSAEEYQNTIKGD